MKRTLKILNLMLLTLTLTGCSISIDTDEVEDKTQDFATDKDTTNDKEDTGTDDSKNEDNDSVPSPTPEPDQNTSSRELVDFDSTLPTDTLLKKTKYNGYYKTSNMADYRMEKYRYLSDLNSPYYADSSYRMPTIGTGKLLVIPVYFTDAKAPTSAQLDAIEKAYFGSASDTGWESLASYYSSSSYGKFTFSGKVATPYAYPKSTKAVNTTNENTAYEFVDSLVEDAVEYERSQGLDLTQFDSNSDGYIDGVEIIYFINDSYSSNTTMWWAYTSSLFDKSGDIDDPQVRRYFFSGYSFIANGYYDTDIDSHTLVHESGHMLGLNDYYNYESNTQSYSGSSPAGMVDMMDMNIGDHDAYSKMLLGWVDPYVIDGTSDDFTLTLNSFTDTGECIVLRNTTEDPFNGTPYDEYLILQYYTPTGVNKQDSQGYEEWNIGSSTLGTYSIPGLQVFHVDSRTITTTVTMTLSNSSSLSYKNTSYTDTPLVGRKVLSSLGNSSSFQYSFIPANNTPSYSQTSLVSSNKNESYNLIEALPADTSISYEWNSYRGYYNTVSNMGNNKALFTATGKGGGSNTFHLSSYKDYFEKDSSGNYLFHDGTQLEYTFTVTANDSTGCTLHFTKE